MKITEEIRNIINTEMLEHLDALERIISTPASSGGLIGSKREQALKIIKDMRESATGTATTD